MKHIQTLFPDMPAIQPPSDIIRALWWNQPFANLMLPPYLKDETRTRATNVRGKVLICACLKPYTIAKIGEISGNKQYMRIVQSGLSGHVFHRDNLGMAIGIGNLTECRLMTKEDEDKCFVEYKEPWYDEVPCITENGLKGTKLVKRILHVWHFEDVKPIQPFEIAGKQGWAILDDETKAKIKVL